MLKSCSNVKCKNFVYLDLNVVSNARLDIEIKSHIGKALLLV